MVSIEQNIATALSVSPGRVAAARKLFQDGATVPFVARYRKEQTGGLDEVQLRQILDLDADLTELERRRESVLKNLTDRGLLTGDLERSIRGAPDRNALEDLYGPYKQRKETRADKARNAGLGPLASALLERPGTERARLLAELKPPDMPDDAALEGACDILAEGVAHDIDLRRGLRRLFERQGALRSRRKGKDADERYRTYFDWKEPAGKAPSHRVLAMLRGAAEGALTVTLRPPEEGVGHLLRRRFPEGTDRDDLFDRIASDAWKRLLLPSLEREALSAVREKAEITATEVFRKNLEALLLAPPLGSRRVLAIDPGIRTGCKVVCLGAFGEVLASTHVFPLPPRSDADGAATTLQDLCDRYQVEAIAVGNGTGGREVEQFLREKVVEEGASGRNVLVVSVDEAGASVYSASDIARKEFPDMDIHFRGAVSIGRRLQDPLAELVKIDPRSIGVGQYQHDVTPSRLAAALEGTIESCVNRVGVDVNTAGVPLLRRVAGLSEGNAAAIVSYRDAHGLFQRRGDIARVSGIGPRTVEQAVGFLRCPVSEDPLENTGVHPERYPTVEQMAGDAGLTVAELVGNDAVVRTISAEAYVGGENGPGLPTIEDIIDDLLHPGRDPRADFTAPGFRNDVTQFEDLEEGMVLEGIVRNVTAFGAFVDVGVHQDGLVHISRMSRHYVRDPADLVSPGQRVTVRVVDLDGPRQRIGLSMTEVEDH
jgi:protein Tex